MVNILVTTHGSFCRKLLEAAEKIAGKQNNLYAVEMQSNESLPEMQAKLKDSLERIVDETGQGTLILVDMLGGTPCNAAVPLCRVFNTEIVTGVNLPMLLSAMFASKKFESAKEVADKVFKDGQKSIINVKRLI
ncbi:MAG: PTS sugar transporter subunit IIA [Elusimicrobiota bacterium]|jgi:PTS system mannose-specific IIA component|nr:PTS sugar transporter subunit IIA [Elusimicrobiota bacterium]